MTTVLLAPSVACAQATAPAVTIEAEYGAFVLEGALYTAAHHQPLPSIYAGRHAGGVRPAPCNDVFIPLVMNGTIVVSHLDLDTFGGCLRAMGWLGLFDAAYQPFWNLAEHVDTRGAHRLHAAKANVNDVTRLYDFWAWSKSAAQQHPRDVCTDVTADVHRAGQALVRIFRGDADLRAAGVQLRQDGTERNARTYRDILFGGVISRVAEAPRDFCNDLYDTPMGTQGRAVGCYNSATGSVTISLADPIEGVSCRDIVQALWGPDAGGHAGIAGSPRGQVMTLGDFHRALQAMVNALEGK